MMDLSKQQRWVILILVGALISGAVLLAFFRRSGQEQVFALEEETETLVHPEAETSALTNKVYVHVCGAVQKPGVYQLSTGDRIFQAVDAAGGASKEADPSALNLAAPIKDGEQIYLPKVGELPKYRPQSDVSGASGRTSRKQRKPVWPLDLNQAGSSDLEAVPGIGPSMAARIAAFRDQNGPFASVDDLSKVSGIGPKKLEQFRDYLCVR